MDEFILPAASVPLAQYSPEELRLLRRRVDDLLPGDTLSSLDLTQELLITYRDVQQMLKMEDDAPLNQRSQTTNTLTSILKQLAELQRSHFSASRLQAFEKALAALFRKYPGLQEDYVALLTNVQ